MTGDQSSEDGFSGGPVHRRPVVVGGEAAAMEAEVHVEDKRGVAQAASGEVRVRPAELLPELRRRPRLLQWPPLPMIQCCN